MADETTGNTAETIFVALRKPPETVAGQHAIDPMREIAMNSIAANVVGRETAKTEIHPLAAIVVFCSVGLVAALVMASLGFDLGAGFL